jgi:DNA-binding transcriptional regulator YiaG
MQFHPNPQMRSVTPQIRGEAAGATNQPSLSGAISPFTGRHSQIARAYLGLSVEQVARTCGLGSTTIAGFEHGRRKLRPVTKAKLRRFFESHGLAFHANGMSWSH